MDPRFLDVNQAIRLHRELIERYGGIAGVRDMGLLLSALAQPEAMFAGQRLHGDVYEMAAAYLFHIVRNHPFLDGNKRTGAAAALVFLAINDIPIHADEDSLVELTLGVAQGQYDKPRIAAYFRDQECAHP